MFNLFAICKMFPISLFFIQHRTYILYAMNFIFWVSYSIVYPRIPPLPSHWPLSSASYWPPISSLCVALLSHSSSAGVGGVTLSSHSQHSVSSNSLRSSYDMTTLTVSRYSQNWHFWKRLFISSSVRNFKSLANKVD